MLNLFSETQLRQTTSKKMQKVLIKCFAQNVLKLHWSGKYHKGAAGKNRAIVQQLWQKRWRLLGWSCTEKMVIVGLVMHSENPERA
jgi:hypothetical protein